ncbi:hypothetical protein LCGC14_3058560, partial [marine sediment metagenome]
MRRALTMLMLPVAVLAICARAPGQVPLDDLFAPAPGRLTAVAKFGARAIPSVRTVKGGDSLHVAVEMTIAEKFWVYGPYAAGKIVAAQDLTIEPGKSRLKVGEVLFGPTHRHVTDFPDGTRDTHNVYTGRVYAYVPVTVPSDLPAGEYELPLVIEGQVCDPNVCLQLSTTVTATVRVSDATAPHGEWAGPVSAALAEARTAGQWREELAGQGERIDFEVFGGSAWAQLGLAGGLALAFLAG